MVAVDRLRYGAKFVNFRKSVAQSAFLRPSLFTRLQSFFLVSIFLGQLSHSKHYSSHRSVIGNRRVLENLGEGEVPAAVTGQMPIRNSSCPVTRLTGT